MDDRGDNVPSGSHREQDNPRANGETGNAFTIMAPPSGRNISVNISSALARSGPS